MGGKPTAHGGSTALVTGGAGFIGSHVVEALLERGDRVIVVDDLSTGSAENLPPEVPLEVVDISDQAAFDKVIDKAKPAVIHHLGAQSSVTVSVTRPDRDCEVNVRGTLNVLLGATRHNAPLVFTSTGGALYGDRAPIPTTEDSPPAPISPYGASKWAGEAYVNTWRGATGIRHSVCRLGNVYGPRQSPHGEAGVVAIFSHLLWRGESPKLYGHGKATRDYVHAQDVAQALLAAEGSGGTFNVSTGIETPVSHIFEVLQQVAGSSVVPQLEPLRAGELNRSCMSPKRAHKELNWRATINLDEGLADTYRQLVVAFEERV
jgi:UDP-glucose 4-epimerase